MTDIAELHAQALDATGRIVGGVAPDRWHAATPCAGWDARTLVNHLVAGNLCALGPRVAVPAGASAQTRFLALLGRAG